MSIVKRPVWQRQRFKNSSQLYLLRNGGCAMNKQYLMIIAAMMLLTPFAAYSSSTTKMKDPTPVDRSKTDTYSDGMMGQPMKDIKDMKSDKMREKSKTGVKAKIKSGETKTDVTSQEQAL